MAVFVGAMATLTGCQRSKNPVESGSLDNEKVTHEFEIQEDEEIRIELDGSFNNPQIVDPDDRDILGTQIIIENDITLTATAGQTGRYEIILVGDGSYEIYIN
jgi:hypothetical protein